MRIVAWLMSAMVLSAQPAAAEAVFRVDRARQEVTLKGYTRGETRATLSSEVSGKVLQVNYETGDKIVERPIVVIDTTFIDYQIQQTRHAIDRLQISLERQRSRAAYLAKEYRRIEALFKQNSTAESQKDSAAEDLRQSELQVAATRVQIEQHRTELDELQERWRRHRISAPPGWVVTDKLVEVGEIVQPGEPLVVISDYRRLVVPLVVSSREIKAISALPRPLNAFVEGHPVKADIHWINPAFNQTSRKLDMQFILNDYRGKKRGGLVFSLPVVIASEGLRVPKAAVISRYENPRVRLKSSGETVSIIILDETGDHYIVAEDGKLLPGMLLAAP